MHRFIVVELKRKVKVTGKYYPNLSYEVTVNDVKFAQMHLISGPKMISYDIITGRFHQKLPSTFIR